MGKGDKIPSRGEVSALRKKYDEARQMLDGARKAVGDKTMNMIEAMRVSRERHQEASAWSGDGCGGERRAPGIGLVFRGQHK